MKSTAFKSQAQLELELPRAEPSGAAMTRHDWRLWLQQAASDSSRPTYRSHRPHAIILEDARERLTVDARCELAVALDLAHAILDFAEDLPPHVQPARVRLLLPRGDVYRAWELGAGDRYTLAGGAS